MDAFSKFMGIILAIIFAAPTVLFWGYIIYSCFFTPSSKKDSQQEPEKTTPDQKETPHQYVRNYPPPKSVQPPQPPRESNDYLRNYKNVQSSGISCDSTGNIKPAPSSVKPPKKRKAPLIVTIVLVVFFVLLFAICLIHDSSQDSNPEIPETHAHEYVNGQCSSCLSYDTAYWWPKYREILGIMSSMDSPIDDLITIEEKLKNLPEDYLQVKRLTAQQFVLYKQCTIIRDESASADPDYEKIQDALFTLLEKKDSESYDSWNMSSLVESFFDSSLYANGNITWSLLRGYWESSKDYYLSFDSSGVSSNIPHPYSNTFGYHYFAYDDIVYVSKSPDGPWLEAYRIDQLSGDGIVLYCYSTDTSYFFVHKESKHTNSSSGSDSNISYALYIGNIKTKKFHYSFCSYLPDRENREYITDRISAIRKGYSPCEHCDP